MTSPHIVVVSKTFPPAAFPESHVTAKVVHGLLQAGVDVTVITSDEWGSDHTVLEQRLSHPRLQVLRAPFIPSLSRRIPVHLACALLERSPIGPAHFVSAGRRLFRESHRPPSLIYARGLPSHGYFLGASLAKEYRVPLILHLADPWPKNHWPPPYSNRMDAAEWWEEKASHGPLQAASAFTIASTRLASYLRQRLPALQRKPFCVLPHPMSPWEPEPVEDFLTGRRGGRMEIVHAGSLDDERDPRNFLKGLRLFLDRHPQAARLHLIGAGWPKLSSLLDELRLRDDVRSVATLDYLQTLSALRSADILLLFEAALDEGIFLPSKFADYCWAARPILAVSPRQGEVSDYLARIGSSVTPADSSPAHFAEALGTLHQQWLASQLGDASALCPLFDGAYLTARLLDFLSPYHPPPSDPVF